MLPQKLLEMSTEAFHKTYDAILADGYGLKEAYEKAEEGHKILFHKRKYSSYASFRKTRQRRINKQKNKE